MSIWSKIFGTNKAQPGTGDSVGTLVYEIPHADVRDQLRKSGAILRAMKRIVGDISGEHALVLMNFCHAAERQAGVNSVGGDLQTVLDLYTQGALSVKKEKM